MGESRNCAGRRGREPVVVVVVVLGCEGAGAFALGMVVGSRLAADGVGMEWQSTAEAEVGSGSRCTS